MRVAGERVFAAPRDAVWHVLNDPASMAATMPGVESFDVQDDRHWRANVKIPLGLGALGMTMNMEKTEERPPDFARLAIKGNGVGAILSMSTAFTLSDDGVNTKMDWEADVRIAGPVGSMGQRVLQPIVNQQVQHVLSALDDQEQRASATQASDVKDYGEPPEGSPDPEPETGTSGADEGVSPLAPETYEPEPEGPTTSTEG
jgi:carbon monoxide dehydrogenase subunit G